MSKCLDPDQDRHSVGPDLGPNCLQRLSISRRQVANRKKTVHVLSKANGIKILSKTSICTFVLFQRTFLFYKTYSNDILVIK